MKDLNHICRKSVDLVREVGAFILQEKGKVTASAIEEKALNSLVSYVDRQAEIRLVDGLRRLLPGAAFLTEEDTVVNEEGDQQWIIDPLDGTTNFLHQLPLFSVSVALRREGRTVLGIVYEINRQEAFYAWEGGGAFLNGSPIRVSSSSHLAGSLLATGFPYYDYQLIKPYFQVLEHFMRHTRGIRRLGSAAVDLAYVACGRFDGFFEYSLNPWDVAGGAFLVQQAGGQVADFRGGKDFLFGQELVAAGAVFNEMLSVVKKAFYG